MFPFYSHFITSIGPWTLTRSREWFQQCLFPCPHPLPIQAATTAGERDGPNASPALSTFYVVLTLHASHRQPVDAFSIPQFPWLAFSRPFVRASVQSRPVLLKRLLLHHFFFPHPLTHQVLTAHFGPVFFGQIVVPLFSHRGFVCLERFVLSRGLETSNPLMIESVVEGLGVLHPVHGRFFPFLYCRCCSIFLARGSMV